MKSLVKDRRLYDQVYYDNENHYETIVKKHLGEILSNFHIVDFKCYVRSDEGIRRRADIALIEKNYRMWVVVEVELAHHSFTRHVFPQLSVLAQGEYADDHADYLIRNNQQLDPMRTLDLVRYEQPKIAVVVNSTDVLSKGWGALKSDLGVEITYLEVFRSDVDDSIFSLSGYRPAIQPERIAGARKQKMMNCLTCKTPDAIPRTHSSIKMFFMDRPIIWKVIRTADKAILVPQVSVSLVDDRNYEILRSEDGRLVLRQL